MNIRWVIAGIVTAVTVASPMLAEAQNDCLQRNRIQSWKAINDNTVVYTDRSMNQWTVTFRDQCRNLTSPTARLVYRNMSSLKCLARNDPIRVAGSGHGMSTCRVDTVKAGGIEDQSARALK
jgi:hypothetical protein